MAKTRASAKTPKTKGIQPRVKVWIDANGEYAFGRGISEILSAVEETGSIKAAAERVGKSYRHVWARVKQAEEHLGVRLVETHVGGAGDQRSVLSSLGRELVNHYNQFRQRLLDLVAAEFSPQFEKLLNGSTRSPGSRQP